MSNINAGFIGEFYRSSFVNETSDRPHQRFDDQNIIEPYADILRTALSHPLDPDTMRQFSEEMARFEPRLRYRIMANTLTKMSDEEILQSTHMTIPIFEGDPGIVENEELLDLRTYVDKQIVADRLAALEMIDPPEPIDQDELFERALNPDNEFSVRVDELLALNHLFNPTKSTSRQLIERYNVWRKDPEGGAKIVKGDDDFPMAFAISDFAMGARISEAKKDMSLESALELAELYKNTQSYIELTELVQELLFERSAAGVTLYEQLIVEGFSETLHEDEQIQRAYGLALAANNQPKKAMEVAMRQSQTYEDYAYITMEIARILRANDDKEGALATLNELTTVDPVANFLHNTTEDDHVGMMGGSPTGIIFESVAEEYAKCGSYDAAVRTYKRSRQYPQQTEKVMARIAADASEEQAYLESIVNFEGDEHDQLFMMSRLTVALLSELDDRLPLGVSMEEQHPDIVIETRQFIPKLYRLSQEQSDSLGQRVVKNTLFELHSRLGDADHAIAHLKIDSLKNSHDAGRLADALRTYAKQGHYTEAVRLFDENTEEFPLTEFPNPKMNSMIMGWALVNKDNETFDRFIGMTEGYRRPEALITMLRTFSDYDLQLKPELMRMITHPEYDKIQSRIDPRQVARLCKNLFL